MELFLTKAAKMVPHPPIVNWLEMGAERDSCVIGSGDQSGTGYTEWLFNACETPSNAGSMARKYAVEGLGIPGRAHYDPQHTKECHAQQLFDYTPVVLDSFTKWILAGAGSEHIEL